VSVTVHKNLFAHAWVGELLMKKGGWSFGVDKQAILTLEQNIHIP
jgi:hypothetical protein